MSGNLKLVLRIFTSLYGIYRSASLILFTYTSDISEISQITIVLLLLLLLLLFGWIHTMLFSFFVPCPFPEQNMTGCLWG